LADGSVIPVNPALIDFEVVSGNSTISGGVLAIAAGASTVRGRIKGVPNGLPADLLTDILTVNSETVGGGAGAAGGAGYGGSVAVGPDAKISAEAYEYDKNGGGDVKITLVPGSYTLLGIKNGGYSLKKGVDFTAFGNEITIKASYLATLAEKNHVLVFVMNGGIDPKLTITIINTSGDESAIGESASNGQNDLGGCPFIDVKIGDWFYDNVMIVYNHGLMVGTNDDPMEFGPNMTTTRAMVATILYRMAGSPETNESENPFIDAASGEWYSDAIKWAAVNGVCSGYGNGLFGPDDPIDREQMAVFFVNFMKYKGYEWPSGKKADFRDESDISIWALESVKIAREAGIIEGKPDDVFDPRGFATRAEVAVVLGRLMELK
jgi:hypothetical protein